MASGSDLKASLTLNLDDLLSPGIKRLLELFNNLQAVLKTVRLDGLTNSASGITKVTDATTGLTRALHGIEAAAGRAGSAMGRLWTRAQASAGRAVSGLKGIGERIGIIGAAGASAAVMGPLHLSSEFDFLLRHTAITEGFSGAAAEVEIKRLGRMINLDALKAGQPSASAAEAFRDLIQRGMSPAEAEALIGVHSRAATAYGISPVELGAAVFALGKNMGIDASAMPLALAGMAQASKEGIFKVRDFSSYLTGQTGLAKGLGMQGIKGAATLFAMNEIVAQRTTTPQQAGEWISSALGYISQPATAHAFTRAGYNLNASMRKGEAAGMDQFDTFLGILKHVTHGLTGRAYTEKLGALLGRQEEFNVWSAVLSMSKEFEERRARYGKVDPKKPDDDFWTASAGFGVALGRLGERVVQIARAFGDDFVPVLRVVNVVFKGMLDLINWCKEGWPTATKYILMGAGAFLVLAAGLGAVALVWPALAAGFGLLTTALGLLLTPIGLVVAAIGGVAYAIYDNWDWFKQWWANLAAEAAPGIANLKAAIAPMVTWCQGFADEAVLAITNTFDMLIGWFEWLWNECKRPFQEALDTIKKAFASTIPKAADTPGQMPTGAGGEFVPTGLDPAANLNHPPAVTVNPVFIIERAGPDTTVVSPDMPGAAPVAVPGSRGRVLGRP